MKWTEEKIKILRIKVEDGITYSEIMKIHNIPSKGTLSYMKNKSLEYKEYMEMLVQ